MSTVGVRDFRPRLHFTTPKGWINDPNGLVFYGGKYHLFYQHHPHDTKWGPMHWGHAISDDLLHWEHLPIALYPDERGTMFSGSAVADLDNISGLSKEGKIPLVAFYTCHGEQEEQSIAYSLDGLNFTKYEKNPVIPNPGLKDFRDPKMFWNPRRSCWSMALAATDRIAFYASKDLLSWEKTGEFKDDCIEGIWECPDMVALEHEGKTMWLLVVSAADTYYFLGDFDGDKFICTEPFGYAERLDTGWDNYAGVTYNNVDKPIFLAWATYGRYADKTPTGEYCGTMTLPRSLKLVKTPLGPRLASFPIGLEDGKPIPNETKLDSETFLLRLKGKGACTVKLGNKKGQSLRFGVDKENNFFLDRSNAGANDFSEDFATKYSLAKAKRFFDGAYELDFIFDVSISELFIDGGTRSICMVCYPDAPYDTLTIEGDVEARYRHMN